MSRVTCTCQPGELLACPYCRTEYYRTLPLAMKSPDGPVRMRFVIPHRPYRTRLMQYGEIVERISAA